MTTSRVTRVFVGMGKANQAASHAAKPAPMNYSPKTKTPTTAPMAAAPATIATYTPLGSMRWWPVHVLSYLLTSYDPACAAHRCALKAAFAPQRPPTPIRPRAHHH